MQIRKTFLKEENLDASRALVKIFAGLSIARAVKQVSTRASPFN